ncbi:MAG: hypothetical protein K8H88_06160, partial [Sandaracinaceae bacterium]|nr:hypothetical protein [Sandaracinaceae bacterium]
MRFAPVTLGFEGRARTLPLLSLAIAFRFQPERVARALRTLIGGVPEKSTVSSPPGQLSLPNDPALGRGGKGGS